MRTVLKIWMACMFLAGSPSFALSPSPLPPVELVDGSGSQVSADQLGKGTSILLVLVRKGSPGGEKMLAYLNSLEPKLPAGRLHIVVSGADDQILKTLSERFKDIHGAVWYRDAAETLMKRMDLQATPVIIGVRNSIATWSIVGTGNGNKLDGKLRDWLKP